MTEIAPYDPNLFVEFDWATYPTPPPYRVGDWWIASADGTLDTPSQPQGAQDVIAGDRIYCEPHARRYGELTYGGLNYGDPGDTETEFAELTEWIVWPASLPPWQQPPPPDFGCPLGERRLPGWEITVDALLPVDPTVRSYGELNYGDGTYGEERDDVSEWVDLARAGFSVLIDRGDVTVAPAVPVDELEIELNDPDETLFSPRAPIAGTTLTPAAIVRVGIRDTTTAAWEGLVVCRLETATDVHERAATRLVVMQAVGLMSDLVTPPDGRTFVRPEESARDRIDAIQVEAEWDWGPTQYPGAGFMLRAIDQTQEGTDEGVQLRAMLDRTAISSAWQAHTDREGNLELVAFPFRPDPTADPLIVVDCPTDDYPDAMVSPSITYAGDLEQLVNLADVVTTDPDAPLSASARDNTSVAFYGRRTEGAGMPLPAVDTRDQADLDTLAAQVVDRQARIAHRVVSFEVDTHLDAAWVDVLRRIDIGDPVIVKRTGLPVEISHSGYVLGVQHRMQPNRWQATISIGTTTPTI